MLSCCCFMLLLFIYFRPAIKTRNEIVVPVRQASSRLARSSMTMVECWGGAETSSTAVGSLKGVDPRLASCLMCQDVLCVLFGRFCRRFLWFLPFSNMIGMEGWWRVNKSPILSIFMDFCCLLVRSPSGVAVLVSFVPLFSLFLLSASVFTFLSVVFVV